MRSTWLAISILSVALAAGAMAQDSERTISMKDLPPAVQHAVQEQSKGAAVGRLSQEVAEGVTRYEVEIVDGGHSKDVLFEANGEVATVEEKTAMANIPAPAREAIEGAAGDGKVLAVESLTEHGSTSYEARVRIGQKTEEVKVDAYGKPAR